VKLSDEAQEKLFREIGSHLQQARQAQGISVEQVSMNTRIKPAFLLALEAGQAEELPEAIFVQGFIRRYAEGMGLNGVDLADKFSPLLPAIEVNNEDLNLEKKSSFYIPLAVPYILLLAAASFGLFYILNPKQSKESTAQKPSIAVTRQATPTATTSLVNSNQANPQSTAPKPSISLTPTPLESSTPTVTPTPVVSPTPVASATPTVSPTATAVGSGVETGIELQDESWVRVKADGKTVFEGTLKKGHKQSWTAQKEIVIRSGNAGAVFVSVNKQPGVVMGGVGTVKEIKYNPTEVTPTPDSSPKPQ
jgi:cytoskeletal protein RodZ